jgi:hypothetical protein
MLFRGEGFLESVPEASGLLVGVDALLSANSFVVVVCNFICRASSEASSDRDKLKI